MNAAAGFGDGIPELAAKTSTKQARLPLHARTHACTHAHMHTRTHARTHAAPTHACRAHARRRSSHTFLRALSWVWSPLQIIKCVEWCMKRKKNRLRRGEAISEVLVRNFKYWRRFVDLGILPPDKQASNYRQLAKDVPVLYHKGRPLSNGQSLGKKKTGFNQGTVEQIKLVAKCAEDGCMSPPEAFHASMTVNDGPPCPLSGKPLPYPSALPPQRASLCTLPSPGTCCDRDAA